MIGNIFLNDKQAVRLYVNDAIVWDRESDLPSDYLRVKCIYPTERAYSEQAYYNTLLTLSSNDDVRIDYQIVKYDSAPVNTFLFGVRDSATSRNFGTQVSMTNFNTQWDFGNYTRNRYNAPANDYERHTMVINSEYFMRDGVIVQAMNPIQFASSKQCYLFATNGTQRETCVAKIYRFTVKNYGTTVCDLIPCFRKSDSVVGFYDTVREIFIAPSSDVFTYD